MELLLLIQQFVQQNLMIYCWRDVVEIFVISTIIYAFMRWLSRDKQKNLIGWFYGYCALMLGAHVLDLATLSLLLFISCPLVIMLFIMVHQQTLQKNFVTLTSLTPHAQSPAHWLEELIQGCLHALNKNQEIFCVIERADSLEPFLSADYFVNADMTQELLTLLAATTNPHEATLLWVTHTGKLLALNPTWQPLPDELWVNNDVKALHAWKQHGLFLSEKSDGILFTFDSTTRLCTIIAEGAIVQGVSAHHAFTVLKKYCFLDTQSSGAAHGTHVTQNSHFKQTFTEN